MLLSGCGESGRWWILGGDPAVVTSKPVDRSDGLGCLGSREIYHSRG